MLTNQCCVVKKSLHLQNTNSLLTPCAVLQCSAVLGQWHYTAEITTSESQYEAEFWCVRQVFLQSSQRMKIIQALRDNLVQTPAVTAEPFAYITLFPHRWLCLGSLSLRTCPLSHLLHCRQVGLTLKSITETHMSLRELNRVIIALLRSQHFYSPIPIGLYGKRGHLGWHKFSACIRWQAESTVTPPVNKCHRYWLLFSISICLHGVKVMPYLYRGSSQMLWN